MVDVIDDCQRRAFAESGLVKLGGLMSTDALAPLRARLYALLEAAGVWRDGAWTGPVLPLFEGTDLPLKRLRDVGKSEPFRRLFDSETTAAARALAGGRALRPMAPQAQLLFTPPTGDGWRVPHRVWHLDLPRLGTPGAPGVQLFGFLDLVPPKSGGTLVVAGSHRLLNDRRRRSRAIKKALRRKPFFEALMSAGGEPRDRFLAGAHCVDGVPVRVAELTGEPGDVYCTDLRLLHTLAPNSSPRPRLMVTQRLLDAEVADRLGEIFGKPGRASA